MFLNNCIYFGNNYFIKRGQKFIIRVVLRTLIIYLFISLAIRLMGKRQIGDMQPTELVVTMLISELAAISLQDLGQPVLLSFIGIFILVFLEIGISVITMRHPGAKKVLSGSPVVLISGGKIDQRAMRYVRMSSQDLMQMLREQGIFDVSEVHSAVLELNGNLSVLQKSEYAPITMDSSPETLPMLIISDGKIVKSALSFLNMNEEGLLLYLKKKKAVLSDIYLMTLTRGGESVIINKEERP